MKTIYDPYYLTSWLETNWKTNHSIAISIHKDNETIQRIISNAAQKFLHATPDMPYNEDTVEESSEILDCVEEANLQRQPNENIILIFHFDAGQPIGWYHAIDTMLKTYPNIYIIYWNIGNPEYLPIDIPSIHITSN